MTELDDHELLAAYVRTQSEAAFATLVTRHVSLVHSAALRFTGNPHHAEEIAQAVFIILARKAAGLGRNVVLSGWLYQTARLTAANFMKGEIRRQKREQEAYMQSTLNEPDSAAWRQIAPLLDEAMGRLGETDRNALVLRYFENKMASEIGAALKLNESAAHMRVNRALEKLRKFFVRRGITLSALAIAGAISGNSVQAAPAGLAPTITAVALAKGAVAGGSTLTLVKGALKVMAWTKAKIAVVAGVGVVLAGTTAITLHNLNKPVPLQGIPADWSVLSGQGAQWNWTNNAIYAHSTTGDSILASNRKYGDVTLSATVGSTNRGAELVFRAQDVDNGYHVNYTPDDTPWAADNGSIVKLVRKVAGDEFDLAVFKRGKLPHTAKITVSAKGPRLEVRLNDIPILRTNDATFASGFIGLRVYGDPIKPCDDTYSNLTVQ